MYENEPRMTRPARKHQISADHVLYALVHAGDPVAVDGDYVLFIGIDGRGVELEIGLVPDDKREGGWAIIHVMPTEFRKK